MLILVTNDDGYDADGLWVAYDLAYKIAGKNGRIAVVAPSSEQSGVGHAMSYTKPIATTKRRDMHYTVDGTPTDCILLTEQLIGEKPDLVISGVNRGHNLGPDLLYSGTVGAAIEATAHGIPAIALSQYYNQNSKADEMFEIAREFGPKAISTILNAHLENWPTGRFVNINFPACTGEDVKGIKLCSAEALSKSNVIAKKQEAPNGRTYFWLGHPGPIQAQSQSKDVALVKDNNVTVSFCHLNLSDDDFNNQASHLFEGNDEHS